MEQKNTKQIITLPIAIIIAGALIAGAVIFTKKSPATPAKTDGSPMSEALAVASSIGVKERDIKSCIENRDMQARVARDVDGAAPLAFGGTPYNIVIGPNDNRFAIPGAFPIEYFEKVIAIMEAETPRASKSFKMDDLEGIYNFVMENNALPTIIGDVTSKMMPIDEADHVRGSRDAKIMIVEYSDFECPYCQMHHETMKSLVEKSGDKLAWTYRHFPLTTIHDGAQLKAEASECIAQAKGPDAFWKYADADFVAVAAK